MINRRAFLKTACVAAGTFALGGLAGCSGRDMNAESQNDDVQENEASSSMTEQQEASSSQSSSSQTASSGDNNGGKAAVVYFSCTGNTKKVAEKIAKAADADLMEIEPAEPYTEADLDYNDDCRANAEQNDEASRPAIASPAPDVSAFDTIYLGYPIWWGTAPRIILTFLEGANLNGKTVIPFCTSGSSPISGSIEDLEQAAPHAKWEEGRRFSASVSQQDINEWVSTGQ